MDSEDNVRKCHQIRGRIRDPISGKNSSRIRIPDPGGKKTGSRIKIRNTAINIGRLYKTRSAALIIYTSVPALDP
jgi:hypothetical protein